MFYGPDLAYLTGIAIGDGNLSNPNGRATRLRISCDIKYPNIIERIQKTLSITFPKNKISIVRRKDSCIDISIYNKNLDNLFGWSYKKGPKHKQKIIIPRWIKQKELWTINFIRGLFESDGSIYYDRKYLMLNLVIYNKEIIDFVYNFINKKFEIKRYKTTETAGTKYTLRVNRKTKHVIKFFKIDKS